MLVSVQFQTAGLHNDMLCATAETQTVTPLEMMRGIMIAASKPTQQKN